MSHIHPLNWQFYFTLFCVLRFFPTNIGGIKENQAFVGNNKHVLTFCTTRIIFRWWCTNCFPSQNWHFDLNINGLCHNFTHTLPRALAMELKSHLKIMELRHPCSTCVSTCGCFCVRMAVVLKTGCANGSLNDCAQGELTYLQRQLLLWMSMHLQVWWWEKRKESETHEGDTLWFTSACACSNEDVICFLSSHMYSAYRLINSPFYIWMIF